MLKDLIRAGQDAKVAMGFRLERLLDAEVQKHIGRAELQISDINDRRLQRHERVVDIRKAHRAERRAAYREARRLAGASICGRRSAVASSKTIGEPYYPLRLDLGTRGSRSAQGKR